MDDLPNWLKILSGLLTPVLGIVATAIIVMQFILQKNKWKLDLFDKRYPIYDSTKKYLAKISSEAKISHSELIEFLRETKDSEFLFGEDVNTFLKLIYKRGNDLEFIGKKARTVNVEKERLEALEQEHKLLNWFSDQFRVASELFGKYLKVDKK